MIFQAGATGARYLDLKEIELLSLGLAVGDQSRCQLRPHRSINKRCEFSVPSKYVPHTNWQARGLSEIVGVIVLPMMWISVVINNSPSRGNNSDFCALIYPKSRDHSVFRVLKPIRLRRPNSTSSSPQVPEASRD
jgi:hypothetical protein